MKKQCQQLSQLLHDIAEDSINLAIDLGKFIFVFAYINTLFPIITIKEIVDLFSYFLASETASTNTTITTHQCH